MNEVYKKLNQAKINIKNTQVKKLGYNEYGKYHFFLPEQIEVVVSTAIQELNIFNKYSLKKTDLGYIATMEVIDLETGKSVMYEIPTDIPEITATNMAQKLGGAVTYSKRYLLMIVYDISDNQLDFDAQKPTTPKPTTPKPQDKLDSNDLPWLNKFDKQGKLLEAYSKIVEKAKSKNLTVLDLKKHYKIHRLVEVELNNDLK